MISSQHLLTPEGRRLLISGKGWEFWLPICFPLTLWWGRKEESRKAGRQEGRNKGRKEEREM